MPSLENWGGGLKSLLWHAMYIVYRVNNEQYIQDLVYTYLIEEGVNEIHSRIHITNSCSARLAGKVEEREICETVTVVDISSPSKNLGWREGGREGGKEGEGRRAGGREEGGQDVEEEKGREGGREGGRGGRTEGREGEQGRDGGREEEGRRKEGGREREGGRESRREGGKSK